jgi:hypothetical protein
MVSEAATVPLGKLLHSEKGGEVMATADIVVSNANRLTTNDCYAWTDFYPSRSPCVYKSGPAWGARKGPEA